MKFEALDPDERAGLVNRRTNTVLTVDRTTAGIRGVANFATSPILPTHVELPPTPLALTEENAAEILVHSGDGPKGAWNRFFIMVYFNGGRIFFKEHDSNELEVAVLFA
jgi:hypothetical protein